MITKMGKNIWDVLSHDPNAIRDVISRHIGNIGLGMESGAARQSQQLVERASSDHNFAKKLYRQLLSKATYFKSGEGRTGKILLPKSYTDSIDRMKAQFPDRYDAEGIITSLREQSSLASEALDKILSQNKDVVFKDRAQVPTFKTFSKEEVPIYHSTPKVNYPGMLKDLQGNVTPSNPSGLAQALTYSNLPMRKGMFAYPRRNSLLTPGKTHRVIKGSVPANLALFSGETSRLNNHNPMPEIFLGRDGIKHLNIHNR